MATWKTQGMDLAGREASDVESGLGQDCGTQRRARKLMHGGGGWKGTLGHVPVGLKLQGVEGGPVPPSCLLRLLMAAAPQCPASPGACVPLLLLTACPTSAPPREGSRAWPPT